MVGDTRYSWFCGVKLPVYPRYIPYEVQQAAMAFRPVALVTTINNTDFISSIPEQLLSSLFDSNLTSLAENTIGPRKWGKHVFFLSQYLNVCCLRFFKSSSSLCCMAWKGWLLSQHVCARMKLFRLSMRDFRFNYAVVFCACLLVLCILSHCSIVQKSAFLRLYLFFVLMQSFITNSDYWGGS